MNYIDISTPSIEILNININLTDISAEASLIQWSVYADGNDTVVTTFDNAIGNAQVTLGGYYQTLAVNTAILTDLKDETQYSLVGELFGNVVYRGKFQTTSKDINSLSVNEGQYIKKTTATNYTILD